MTIGVLNFLVKIFSNEKTLLFHSFVKVNMKKLTLLIALGFTSMVFGQNPSLPKAIGKNMLIKMILTTISKYLRCLIYHSLNN